MITLSTELERIRGISPQFLKRLERLSIVTVKDLLWHFPFRYEDFSEIVQIAELQENQNATIRGVVRRVDVRRAWRKNMTIIEAVVEDDTGAIRAVWFNQPYIGRSLRPGLGVNLAGRVTLRDEVLALSNPTYEVVQNLYEAKHTGRLIPIYPETKGLTSRGLRYLVKPILSVIINNLKDFIPDDVLAAHSLPSLAVALRNVHFPETMEQVERAKKRFSFEDLFLLQLNNLKIRSALTQAKASSLSVTSHMHNDIRAHLPFHLTESQNNSLTEIIRDLEHDHPMNRLLQGDVGSGKTVVAAYAALLTAFNNKQAVFMAPTEVLARQHYKTLTNVFGNLFAKRSLGVGLLTGTETRTFYGPSLEEQSSGKKARAQFLNNVSQNTINIIIGTHALITPAKTSSSRTMPLKLSPADLALIIIDEQHRFGVDQRAALARNQKLIPHFLSMSATPIPRTLSLTLFGDLDISLINELPKGRKPIITRVVHPEKRATAYGFIRAHIQKGRQAFVICPRIEVSEPQEDNASLPPAKRRAQQLWADVKTVKEEYERLSKHIFPELTIAMLHGKLKAREKADIMKQFHAGTIHVLVSTSVVEVGIDVPNASIMMIEGADRFGLSQLYQFRGRIGRGEHQSFCLLFTNSTSQTVKQRLDALLKATNGFELAEQDLKLRGPGQFLGDKQTGLPDLAMKSLNNIQLIKDARDSAEMVFSNDPDLKNHPPLAEKLTMFQNNVHLE
ncbi:MAG: ATP-dependent DNA helicase RecG [Candidatus Harrisonbacteria bacterium CG10_big_fil_rev_8_21_14_0_10_42_17]|uniref:Probable DNA 3'-5' helicase RecG n=1 Tax=Candidatus Harrisonbacteria bacterium CG10_big_fil_rev_8_21_14_0_10_42_17 TaxID=1974584 RepID=A0A2M6WID9_9BACT|nr:MAG: ATP-dependent DNA helicase RecG [Candidatus Harrisonbacteria bacterium CG10_big_fil_rev_8_21_14_0_10_42_17]